MVAFNRICLLAERLMSNWHVQEN